MRIILCALVCVFMLAAIACAAELPKVDLQAKGIELKDAAAQLSSQVGVAIVLDPEAKGTVTAALNDVDLSQALTIICQSNNLTWKKLKFASSENAPVSLDQIKYAIIALKAMPIVAFAVEDPKTGAKAVYSKDMPASSEVPELPLSEGYAWKTIYVILASELTDKDTASAGSSASVNSANAKTATDIKIQNTLDLAQLKPEERRQAFANELTAQMTLTPAVRRELFRDQMYSIYDLNPEQRKQYFNDMSRAIRDARNVRKQMGLPTPNIKILSK